MKKRLYYSAIPLVILAITGLAITVQYGKNRDYLQTVGIIEGREVNISPKIPGRISFLCGKEGDTVQKGSVAVRLEANDLKASVLQAQAGVEKAKAGVHAAEFAIVSAKANAAGAEADVQSAAADVEKTRVQMEESKRLMDRARALYGQAVISVEACDTATANYDASAASHTASESGLASARSKRDAAVAQMNEAEIQLEYARAALKEARAYLFYNRARFADTIIKSPISGIVTFKALEKGEMAAPGTTILTIVDMNDLYARVDIEETLAGDISLNAGAVVRQAGNSARVFHGKVSEIGRYAEFATQRDVLRGRQDIKTFRVTISVDDPTGFLKPGMTVEAEIRKMNPNNEYRTRNAE